MIFLGLGSNGKNATVGSFCTSRFVSRQNSYLHIVRLGTSDVLLLLLDQGGDVEEVDLLKDLLNGQALPARHVGLGVDVHFRMQKNIIRNS